MALEELRELLGRHAYGGDQHTAIDGVRICRFDRPVDLQSAMSGTVLAVVAQGSKRLTLGDRVHDYGPGEYLIASVDLPVTGQVLDPRGTLGFGMTLEPSVIAELLLQAGPDDLEPDPGGPGIAVSTAPAELLDAIVRLLRLLDRPRDRKVLAPLIQREILWLLMTGDQGAAVRQIGLTDSGLRHVRRAIRWIRENYAEPFRVEELARLAGMSVSAFHRNFQAVTSLSPIQFQKQIRLQEARLQLANRPGDVTGVGHRVGYDSASQFSREYRRQFGVPPSSDVLRPREDQART